MTSISLFSLLARSCRPPFSYCSTESRRCLTRERSSFVISSSSISPPFSISRFMTAAFTIRSVEVRGASCAFIDAVRSEITCCFKLIDRFPPRTIYRMKHSTSLRGYAKGERGRGKGEGEDDAMQRLVDPVRPNLARLRPYPFPLTL